MQKPWPYKHYVKRKIEIGFGNLVEIVLKRSPIFIESRCY